MSRICFLVFITLYAFTLSQCKTQDHNKVNTEIWISYGSFGGFAGSYTEYQLYPDGRVMKKDKLEGPYKTLSPVQETIALQCFDLCKSFRADDIKLFDPGNLSYFIRLHEKGQATYEIIWGGVETEPPPRIGQLYQNLIQLSRDKNPVM